MFETGFRVTRDWIHDLIYSRGFAHDMLDLRFLPYGTCQYHHRGATHVTRRVLVRDFNYTRVKIVRRRLEEFRVRWIVEVQELSVGECRYQCKRDNRPWFTKLSAEEACSVDGYNVAMR